MKKGKIFIQIASYRDPELVPTIKNCIEKAKYPNNLVFSIAWQHSSEDEWDTLNEFKNDERFKIIDIPYKDSKGACWARNTLQQQYDGEEFTLQLDSHHRFIKNWDVEIKKMYRNLVKKGYKKPLLTSYIPSYDPKKEPNGRVEQPWLMNFDRFIPEGAIFFLPATIPDWENRTEPVPSRFYSAHFAFTTGKFVEEVPHDPNYYFHGEEISIAVRAYTHGYDLFHPHKIIAWHEYTREGRTKHWDDDNQWVNKNNESHLRNRKLFEMDGLTKDIEFGIYDFGTERTLADYEAYAGISFSKRAIQKYTLENNIAPNPIYENPEAYDKSFLKIFKHCIDLNKNSFQEPDYDFCAVIFEDETGTALNRKDLTGNELRNLINNQDNYIKLWQEFQTDTLPKKWIVWPHTISKGWVNRLEGNL